MKAKTKRASPKSFQLKAEALAKRLDGKKFNGIELYVSVNSVRNDPDFIEEQGKAAAKQHELDYALMEIRWDEPCEPELESNYEEWNFNEYLLVRDLQEMLQEEFGDEAEVGEISHMCGEVEIQRKK